MDLFGVSEMFLFISEKSWPNICELQTNEMLYWRYFNGRRFVL